MDFCAAGVLGADGITAEDTGSDCNADADAPAGDQLVVTIAAARATLAA